MVTHMVNQLGELRWIKKGFVSDKFREVAEGWPTVEPDKIPEEYHTDKYPTPRARTVEELIQLLYELPMDLPIGIHEEGVILTVYNHHRDNCHLAIEESDYYD